MHALELPEIQTLIAQQLKKPDLAAACRVKKSWFVPFAEQLWKSLEFMDFYRDAESLLQSLPRYAIYVHGLHFPSSSSMECLTLTPALSRLTFFAPSHVTEENRILIQDILRQNPLLEEVFIESAIDIPEEKEAKARELVKVILQLKRLKLLIFRNNWVSSKLLESLIWGLPKLSFLCYGTIEFRTHIELDLAEKGMPADDDEDYLEGDDLAAFQEQHPLLLETVQMRSPGRLFSSMVKIIQSCPLLTTLMWDESRDHFDVFDADLQSLALAVHTSCPRLNNVDLNCEWMKSGDFYQLVSLWEPLSDCFPLSWLPLTSISIYRQDMKTSDVLEIVWNGRDVLQHTLTDLDLDLSWAPRRQGMRAISILETFPKLQRLALNKTIVDAKSFFHPILSPPPVDDHSEGPTDDVLVGRSGSGGSNVDDDDDDGDDSEAASSHHSPEIKIWACNSLRYLEIEIQGVGPSWCPPEVLKDQNRNRGVASLSGYPLFSPLKTYLDSFPELNQSKIQYSSRSPSARSVSPPSDSDREY